MPELNARKPQINFGHRMDMGRDAKVGREGAEAR